MIINLRISFRRSFQVPLSVYEVVRFMEIPLQLLMLTNHYIIAVCTTPMIDRNFRRRNFRGQKLLRISRISPKSTKNSVFRNPRKFIHAKKKFAHPRKLKYAWKSRKIFKLLFHLSNYLNTLFYKGCTTKTFKTVHSRKCTLAKKMNALIRESLCTRNKKNSSLCARNI